MWSNFEAIKFAVLVIPLGTAAIKEGRLIMPPFVLMNINASENKTTTWNLFVMKVTLFTSQIPFLPQQNGVDQRTQSLIMLSKTELPLLCSIKWKM